MAHVLYLVLLAGLVGARPLRRVFLAIPRPQQIAVAALVACAFAGQAIGRSQATYPFVLWSMYSMQTDEADYFRYLGRRPDGSLEPLPVARFVRVHGLAYVVGLRSLALAVERARSEPERQAGFQRYREVLLAGLSLYGERHPERHWTEIEVSRCAIDVASYVAGREPRCTPLWRVAPGAGERG